MKQWYNVMKPEEMVNALQDRIHVEIGVSRPAKSFKVANRKKNNDKD